MAATIEFEKTASGQTRYKWSTEANSRFILNALGVKIFADKTLASQGNVIIIQLGVNDRISFSLSQITTINGEAAPATIEETMLLLTDEVFGG